MTFEVDFDKVVSQIENFNTMTAEEKENFIDELFDKFKVVHIHGFNVGYDDGFKEGEKYGFESGYRCGKIDF